MTHWFHIGLDKRHLSLVRERIFQEKDHEDQLER